MKLVGHQRGDAEDALGRQHLQIDELQADVTPPWPRKPGSHGPTKA